MANEITLAGSLSYSKDGAAFEIALSALKANVSGNRFIRHKQLVATSEAAINLGGLASLGWAIFRNLDPTNFVELRSATGADNDIIKIPPGKFAIFHFGSDVTAPFAIADTAAVLLDYFIAEV